jgi:hypothetical protein
MVTDTNRDDLTASPVLSYWTAKRVKVYSVLLVSQLFKQCVTILIRSSM